MNSQHFLWSHFQVDWQPWKKNASSSASHPCGDIKCCDTFVFTTSLHQTPLFANAVKYLAIEMTSFAYLWCKILSPKKLFNRQSALMAGAKWACGTSQQQARCIIMEYKMWASPLLGLCIKLENNPALITTASHWHRAKRDSPVCLKQALVPRKCQPLKRRDTIKVISPCGRLAKSN